MFVLRDLHFVSWETILAPRLAFAFLFWDALFQKTHPSTTFCSLFIKALLRDYVSQLQFLAVYVQMSHCVDSIVPVLWRLCRIEDSAVLMSLPYLQRDDSAVLRILPYSYVDILCRFFCYECQRHGWKRSSGEMNSSKQLQFWPTGSKPDPIIPAREKELNKARVFCTFIWICFCKLIESKCKS